MIGKAKLMVNRARYRSAAHPRIGRLANSGAATLMVLSLLASGAAHTQPASDQASAKNGKGQLDSITVEAKKERDAADRQANAFVSAVAIQPYAQSLARWNTHICPLVAGLPRSTGEFILSRVSQIAALAGAPLARENCRANFYVVATREPDLLLKAWRQRDRTMFGNASEPKIRGFLHASGPVRVWYNADLDDVNGMPLTVDGLMTVASHPVGKFYPGSIPVNLHARISRLQWDELRDLATVIVIVDTRRVKGVNFGQLADYVSMIGLSEVRLDPNVGRAVSILSLFAASPEAAPPGLTPWDLAFLKALYHTDQTDKMQISMIKTQVARDIAP